MAEKKWEETDDSNKNRGFLKTCNFPVHKSPRLCDNPRPFRTRSPFSSPGPRRPTTERAPSHPFPTPPVPDSPPMKTALVTGSARGIGRAICEELARSGVAQNLVVCDVQKEWCEETVAALRAIEGVKAESLALDVSKEASVVAGVAEAAKLFGSLDIVVNNAGVTRDDLLVRMTEEKWDTVLDINLKGAFLVTREAAKLMMRARSGAIVNIASVVGLMGNAGQANYSASKGGLIALTKTTARELGGRGVRVNAVAPGFINSKMTEVLPDAVKQQMLSIIPLKKFGEVQDIAKAVAFLSSDNASYITGQVISVNGGMLMP